MIREIAYQFVDIDEDLHYGSMHSLGADYSYYVRLNVPVVDWAVKLAIL